MSKCVKDLKKKHKITGIRRIYGDGNCFYRAVYYGYFEMVINKGKKAIEAIIDM